MQIRMNLQQLFTMSVKSARRFLDRWNAWVQVCDLAPMKKLAKTITAKSEGILRSIATGLSNGVLEAINGNVQAAKRKAKGYRTKRNLKAIVYLIAGDVLASSPILNSDEPTFVGDLQINDDRTITYTGSEPGNDNATEHGEYCNK